MEIGFFLQKYAKLGYSQKRTKEIILHCLSEDFSIFIDSKDITVKDTEVKINVSGVKRTHLVLYKEKIEDLIQLKLKSEGIIVSKII